MTYNTAKAQMKWEYKAELRFKALLQTEGVMPDAEISGIVFGSTMEQLSILMQPDAHSYFLLDGSFPHFYYLTNDRYGEAILRLLCDTQQRRTLDAILADGLYARIPNWRIEMTLSIVPGIPFYSPTPVIFLASGVSIPRWSCTE